MKCLIIAKCSETQLLYLKLIRYTTNIYNAKYHHEGTMRNPKMLPIWHKMSSLSSSFPVLNGRFKVTYSYNFCLLYYHLLIKCLVTKGC